MFTKRENMEIKLNEKILNKIKMLMKQLKFQNRKSTKLKKLL